MNNAPLPIILAAFLTSALPNLSSTALRAQHPKEATKQEFQTPCEASGFKEYTSHKEMWDYLQNLQATTTEMKLGSYGKSWQGRELPYAIFSRPTITQPWEAMVSGKPIVLCHANVHGGERTLRESLLIFVRELATKGTPANKLLDDLIILVAPQINPDGFEATPRGTRGNSWGIDMNRDYMKLEQRALANLVQNMHNSWHPHVIIDGHNGGSRPYDLCYQATSNATPAKSIGLLCDKEVFPYINKRMEDNGYRSFYYSGGNNERWKVGGSDPRISRNYSGFINCVGILFESPHGRTTLETGAKAGVVGYRAVLEFTARNPDRVISLVTEARRTTIAMGETPQGEVMVQMKNGPEDFKVDYELRDGTKVTGADIIKKPIVTKSRKRAYAYLLPREARDAVAMLRRHNITVEVLQKTTKIDVEAYKLEDVEYLREYNHAGAVRVKVSEVVQLSRRFPAGTFVVHTSQMHGRVVAHMLEPETNDNVVRWNTMDALLPKTRTTKAIAAASAQAKKKSGPTGVTRTANAGTRQSAERGAQKGGDNATAKGKGSGRQGAGGQRPPRERWGGGAGARRGNRGIGRRRSQGPAVIPIYKLLKPTPLPTRLMN
ncbi:MAG: M14 family zinc carboxypeptidase [Planctomycetota bacterium]|nr:M14 family zinc carboxypeptidase [Planctomycetota bacterium]